jgi:hypothetical protein
MFDWYRLLPQYWLQLYATDEEWDKVLNKLLDANTPRIVSDSTIYLGDTLIYIGGWPDAYGIEIRENAISGLPRVATRKRLKRAVKEAMNGLV